MTSAFCSEAAIDDDVLQMAKFVISRDLFSDILRLIATRFHLAFITKL